MPSRTSLRASGDFAAPQGRIAWGWVARRRRSRGVGNRGPPRRALARAVASSDSPGRKGRARASPGRAAFDDVTLWAFRSDLGPFRARSAFRLSLHRARARARLAARAAAGPSCVARREARPAPPLPPPLPLPCAAVGASARAAPGSGRAVARGGSRSPRLAGRLVVRRSPRVSSVRRSPRCLRRVFRFARRARAPSPRRSPLAARLCALPRCVRAPRVCPRLRCVPLLRLRPCVVFPRCLCPPLAGSVARLRLARRPRRRALASRRLRLPRLRLPLLRLPLRFRRT